MSISFSLINESNFLCEKDSQPLINEFVANLEFLPEKNKADMRSKFLEIENHIRKRLPTIFSVLNEGVGFNKIEAEDFKDGCFE